MRIRRLTILVTMLLGAVAYWKARPVGAIYSYWRSEDFVTLPPAPWQQNGSLFISYIPGGAGGIASGAGGGSLIRVETPPAPSDQYEVQSRIALVATGGTFVHYVKATADALTGPNATGSFYSVELQNTLFNPPSCSATLNIKRRSGGSFQTLATGTVGCRDGMIMRTINTHGWINVYIDGQSVLATGGVTGIGYAGVGVMNSPNPPGQGYYSLVDNVQIGAMDTAAPSAVNAQTVTPLPQQDQVELRWQEPSDGATGTGVALYHISRNGTWIGMTREPNFVDAGLTASTSYNYQIVAQDFHGNQSAGTTFPVSTVAATKPDPLRTGVHSEGAHYGAGGEQIDLRSGNLNYTIPLLKAQSRDFSVGVALSYNSQLWRREGNTDWKVGEDVGYGFGWRLLVGSLTPVWSNYTTIAYYLFRDSTGAEYKLDQYSGYVWISSVAGNYVYYDAYAGRLYFTDGSFWVMDVVSHGAEEDAGTRYPSRAQDSNGNYVNFSYAIGKNAPTANSSSRISAIGDLRSAGAYTFTYNADAVPHLTSITNSMQSGENYNFAYSDQTLTSPGSQGFGPVRRLDSVTQTPTGLSTSFTYSTAGTGEMTKVTFPYSGEIHWTYANWTSNAFSPARTIREVATRETRAGAGAALYSYGLSRDPDSAKPFRGWTTVTDPVTTNPVRGEKKYFFGTTPNTVSYGRLTKVDHNAAGGATGLREEYSWNSVVDLDFLSSRPYIGEVKSTIEPGTSAARVSKVSQALDRYGAMTSRSEYDFAIPPAEPPLLRSYAMMYAHGGLGLPEPNYASRYIRNRLTRAEVTPVGGSPILLVQNFYDTIGWPINEPASPFQWDWSYDSIPYRGNLTRVERPGARPVEIEVDRTGRVRRTWEKLANGADGPQVQYTAAAGTNNGLPGVITPNSDTNKQTTLTWNSFFGPASTKGPNDDIATLSYDTGGRVSSSTTGPNGTSTTYSYSVSPAVTTATTNGRWTKTYMDGFGRTIKAESGVGTTIHSIAETTYEPCACSPLGKMRKTSQPYAPGGTVYWTTYEYDALGRTTKVILPNGQGSTNYVYSGNTVTVTDPAGKWKKYTQDGLGRLAQVEEPNEQFQPIRVNAGSTKGYVDSTGKVWSMDNSYNTNSFVLTTGATIANTADQALYQTQRYSVAPLVYTFAVPNGTYSVKLKFAELYNNNDQRVFNIAINGTTVQANFRPFSAAGGKNIAVDRTYNVSVSTGQIVITLTSVVDAPEVNAIEITGGPAVTSWFTTYSYNFRDQLTTVTMTRGSTTQTRTFAYDPATGRLTGVTNPEFRTSSGTPGTVTYEYYDDGALKKKTDPKGQRIEYVYDTFKRVTEIKRFVNTTTQTDEAKQKTTFFYDSQPNGCLTTGQNRNGRMTAALTHWRDGASGTDQFRECYVYDQIGRTLEKSMTFEIQGWTQRSVATVYTYNNEGQATGMRYPNGGRQLTYSYDSAARPSGMSDLQLGPWVTGVQYNGAQQRTQMTYGGMTETQTFNELNQLTEIRTQGTGGATLMQLNYRFATGANNGRVAEVRNIVSGENVVHQYDALNRLVRSESAGSPSGAWHQGFSYDGFGNLTNKSGANSMSINVDPATNRVAAFTYDLNGNHTPAGTVYDIDNRMVQQARLSGGTNYYAYGASNNRIYKKTVVGSAQTHEVTLWGAFGERVGSYAVTQTSVTKVRESFYFAGKLVATETSAGLRWILTDRLGSVRGVAATSNSLTEALDYYPYGEEKGSATAEDREKFATYHRDSDTGMDYAVNRYHQIGMGRFSTADPASESAGVDLPSSRNRYTYSLGDPVNGFDPSGLWTYCFPTFNGGLRCVVFPDPPSGPPLGGAGSLGGGSGGGEQDLPRNYWFISNRPYEVATELRAAVHTRHINDCEAMAQFATAAASNWIGSGEPISTLIDSFSIFVPQSMVPLGGSYFIASSPTPTFFGNFDHDGRQQSTGQLSGYMDDYQDRVYPNGDQGHHFAAYLMLGAAIARNPRGGLSGAAGSLAAHIQELFPIGQFNDGDRNLSLAAMQLGGDLQAGRNGVNANNFGALVRSLCKTGPQPVTRQRGGGSDRSR